VGLVFLGLFGLHFGLRLIRRDERPLVLVAKLSACLSIFSAVLIATWPYLWTNPPGHFLEALRNMSHFRWGGDVLFMGERIMANELPRSYIFVWIAVTTPLLFLALALLGIGWQCSKLLRLRNWPDESQTASALVLLSLLIPVAAVLLLKPVLYDGWRHFFFIYPSILFFSVEGLASLPSLPERLRWLKTSIIALLLYTLISLSYWLAYAHPFQHLYFNALMQSPDTPFWARMETDYWGVTTRRGLEYILANDPRPVIRVTGKPVHPLHFNRDILEPSERDRIQLVEEDEPYDYFVTCYRFVSTPIDPGMQVYRFILNDSEVLSVYKKE